MIFICPDHDVDDLHLLFGTAYTQAQLDGCAIGLNDLGLDECVGIGER
jgi:hypothetical protein